jgi:hypothetical protein
MSTEHPIPGIAPLTTAIETRGHTTHDGRLHLTLQVGVPDIDVDVVVSIQPVKTSANLDENGWPIGYFDQIAGSMPNLERGPQGEFETRFPLE